MPSKKQLKKYIIALLLLLLGMAEAIVSLWLLPPFRIIISLVEVPLATVVFTRSSSSTPRSFSDAESEAAELPPELRAP
jgi:hypothetical protein